MNMREALAAIAEQRLPCKQCGKAHEWKLYHPAQPNLGGTWAADDGHSYHQPSPAEFAASVLSKEPVKVLRAPAVTTWGAQK